MGQPWVILLTLKSVSYRFITIPTYPASAALSLKSLRHLVQQSHLPWEREGQAPTFIMTLNILPLKKPIAQKTRTEAYYRSSETPVWSQV
ncbi:MAG: hypothetical protein AAF889_13660, partial [Cyanobacteria bacterium P01_D01_bin.73]